MEEQISKMTKQELDGLVDELYNLLCRFENRFNSPFTSTFHDAVSGLQSEIEDYSNNLNQYKR